jgi:hypothetical protein
MIIVARRTSIAGSVRLSTRFDPDKGIDVGVASVRRGSCSKPGSNTVRLLVDVLVLGEGGGGGERFSRLTPPALLELAGGLFAAAALVDDVVGV